MAALATAAPAFAQGTCVPQATPDIAAGLSAPVLFSQCVAEGKCGAIDKTGAWKIPPQHRDVLIAQDFIVVPESDEWNRFGFLEKDGARLGGGDYAINIEEEIPVAEGLMPVIAGGKQGYVDRTGALVIPAKFDEAYAFQGGLAAVAEGEKRFFIDKTGTVVFTAEEAGDVQGFVGDIAVAGKEGTYGLIGRDGKFVMSPRFSSLYIDNGILIALDGEKLGIVDRAGSWISPTDFDSIGQFSNGVAPAEKAGKWGFIDTCGKWKIEPKYDMAVGFEGGPARVKLGGKWGLIDASGVEVRAPDLAYIGDGVWTDGLISFSPDEVKYGLLDATGKIAVEPKYDSVEPLGGGILISYTGEEEKLLDLKGSEIKIAPAP
jgi:hypothetical protein